jgi:hypothetical protein
MSALPDNERQIFSDDALAALQQALERSLASREDGDAFLRPAVERLCMEGRGLQLPPEKMIVAVKAAWEGLAVRPADEERKRRAYERMLSLCLDSYFGARAAH